MSYLIWTAEELSSKAICKKSGVCWRAVEAQHVISTSKLVDNNEEQKILEEVIENTKPPYPVELENYDFLLYTPFRYPPTGKGSRFRKANQKEGVFYAAEKPQTAIAELSFWRLLFFQESPETKIPENPQQLRVFSIKYDSHRAIDLTQPPLSTFESEWLKKNDYSFCQWLADEARKANVELIRSFSARCPNKGKNVSILDEKAFHSKTPESFMQTWQLIIKTEEVTAICDFPRETIVFSKAIFF